MILFLTQYYRGIGHANRIKLLAEETAKYYDTVVVDHLFKPPLDIKGVKHHYAMLESYQLKDIKKVFNFIQQKELLRFRLSKWKYILNIHKPKVVVIEGFPFCRHQFAYEYFSYMNECKKRGIKLLCSIRDYPWDEPHDGGVQDWIATTQNLVIENYFEKILVHGDNSILPLMSDRVKMTNTAELVRELSHKLYYTGYVADDSLKKHENKNNIVYVSLGFNKEEVLTIFKRFLTTAGKFPDLTFVMPMANVYLENIKNVKKGNIILTDYIEDLASKISDCRLFITYGGYNSTMEVLQTQCPTILIPRQNGQKLEQSIRAYAFEHLNCFKICNPNELQNLDKVIKEALDDKEFPKKFPYSLKGVEKSAKKIFDYIS